MGRNFDDYPGFQPFRSWVNTYAQDCSSYVHIMEYRCTTYVRMTGLLAVKTETLTLKKVIQLIQPCNFSPDT